MYWPARNCSRSPAGSLSEMTATSSAGFSTFGKALKKDRYLESIKAHLLTLPSYRRFPTDDEFRRLYRPFATVIPLEDVGA